jgi:acetyl/propionyl-CoA carboxylase alpha subunit
MGDKISARNAMAKAGVPCVPGSEGALPEDAKEVIKIARAIGYPVLIKSAGGGGGRGMRVVHTEAALLPAVALTRTEAQSAFGNPVVYLEKFLGNPRHIEIQVLADEFKNAVYLFERDCSMQRRHQKIIEESPSPAVDEPLRDAMSAAAVAAARAVGYVGAGTVEFLVDGKGEFAFLEMNTRLQVEHPVTEMITGLDLVELQIAVASGHPLPEAALRPKITGHAIEVRLCAEDPYNGYLPSSGTFRHVEFPQIEGVRVDSGVASGSVVSPFYDSMIAKVIAHAPTRTGAINKLQRALTQANLIGPITNRSQLLGLLPQLADEWQDIDTSWLDRNPPSAPLVEPAFVAAAALAWGRSRRTALQQMPPGWRNNHSQFQHIRVGAHDVRYRYDRAGRIAAVVVDDVAVTDARLPTLALIDTEILGDVVFVARGLYRFQVPPRYASPDDAGRAGSTVAPMPGSILRVDVSVGDVVVAGQPLLAMEAMKMEHQVVSPLDGTVAEVFVRAGQQVDSGQPLVRIDST